MTYNFSYIKNGVLYKRMDNIHQLQCKFQFVQQSVLRSNTSFFSSQKFAWLILNMVILLGVEHPQLLLELNVVYSIQGLECRGRQFCGRGFCCCGMMSHNVWSLYVWSFKMLAIHYIISHDNRKPHHKTSFPYIPSLQYHKQHLVLKTAGCSTPSKMAIYLKLIRQIAVTRLDK